MKKKINIVIAEDEQIIAMDIKLTLKNLGYEVSDIVDTGEKVLNILGNKKVDIILMDVMLKGKINGIETAKLVLEKFNVPVIFLTGLVDNEVLQQRTMLKQSCAYLTKPFDNSRLYSTIEMTLFNHKNEMGIKEKSKKFEEGKLENSFSKGKIFPPKAFEKWGKWL